MVFKDSMPPLDFTPTRVKISSGYGGLVRYEPGLYTGQELEIDSSGTVVLSEYHLDDKLESVCFRTTRRDIGGDAERALEMIASYFSLGFEPARGCDTGSWGMLAVGEADQRAKLWGDIPCSTTHGLSGITAFIQKAASLSDAIVFGSELPREEGANMSPVEQVSRAVAFGLQNLPYGSETSILVAAEHEYAPEGYCWERIGVEEGGGYGLSRDGGKTFLIREMDLFDVLDYVEDVLASWRKRLVFEDCGGVPVGLPYALTFTIERKG